MILLRSLSRPSLEANVLQSRSHSRLAVASPAATFPRPKSGRSTSRGDLDPTYKHHAKNDGAWVVSDDSKTDVDLQHAELTKHRVLDQDQQICTPAKGRKIYCSLPEGYMR
jgi:hypothetical protein